MGGGGRRGNSLPSSGSSEPRGGLPQAYGDEEGIIEIKKIISPAGTGDPEPLSGGCTRADISMIHEIKRQSMNVASPVPGEEVMRFKVSSPRNTI